MNKNDSFDPNVPEWIQYLNRKPLVLFFIPFLIFMANMRHIGSGDTTGATFVAIFLSSQGTVYLDDLDQYIDYNKMPYYLSQSGEHIVSNYPLLPGILAAPIFAPFVWMGWIQPGDGNLVWDYLAKLSASIFTSVTVVVFYYALAFRIGKPLSLLVCAYAAFGTAYWPIASQSLWQHTSTILCWTLFLWSAFRAQQQPDRSTVWLALAGFACGLAVASRLTNVVAVMVLFLPLFLQYRHKVIAFLLPCALATGAVILYNSFTFGTWKGGVSRVLEQRWYLDRVSGGVWDTPYLEGMAGLLLSPGRGIFIYSPVLALSLVGMVIAFRNRNWFDVAFILAGYVLLSVYAKYSVWWGGIMHFGPRYQVDAYPFLLYGSALAIVSLWKYSAVKWIILGLSCYSFWVQWIGSFCYPGKWAIHPVSLSEDKERLWNWGYNPITDSFLEWIKRLYA